MNRAAHQQGATMTMADILQEPARSSPGKHALADGRRSYTFAELDDLSTNFAAYLVSRGVQRGDRIAFCATKSAPLIVALLGCLKAGAIYVPVDRKLPKDRLRFILEDVGPRLVVTSPALHDVIAAELPTATGLLDEDRLPEYCQAPGSRAALPRISPDDVAYCIYTSGSTGRPKGVQIQHGSVDALFRALAEVMPIDAGARCMNTSELYFDVHVMDLFFPLHRGATVHLSTGPIVATRLLQTIERERITHFTAVGPVMTLMAESSAFDGCDLSSLVRVMTGAEIINVATMQKWLRRAPGLSIVNGYGPTEVTVICTAHVIDRVEPDRTEFYPIGKPMRGTEVLLHDGERVVSAPGADGELLIAGPQVMKGYWNDAAQTRERIAVIDGKRYYRSGDVCRWRPDGDLDYVGRNDDEIKLSGFRINLNELKRVMDAVPGVKDSQPVVAVHPALGKVIAACVTRADAAASAEDLLGRVQAGLRQKLPYYMVPSLYVAFDGFPAMPSGKTDKKLILDRVERCIRDADPATTRLVCCEPAPRAAAGGHAASPEAWFHRRATHYVETQILFHLNEAGVWQLLRGGPARTAQDIAAALRLDAALTDTLLDYVFQVDTLLERDPERRYSLSEFGRAVVDRYSDTKPDTGRPVVNMFDVRVGAYGPVWHNLGGMLRGEVRYGRDFQREGRYAENGVFKLAMRFWDSLIEHIDGGRVRSIVEVGLTTGLVEQLAERYPGHRLYGLDRSELAIEHSAARAARRQAANVRWIRGDYFDTDTWAAEVDAGGKGLVFSLHFHELIAGGEHRFVEALRRLKARLPGWVVLALEQPRLPHADRERVSETLWLYAQSNILIHHVIGNGKILARDAWLDLGAQAGCRRVTDRACNYLGYHAFAFEL
ncbi:MAG TPA: amino acid adenylation domain-containing protein [Kofleriaceae bacterium]